jgi:hypothetical protein
MRRRIVPRNTLTVLAMAAVVLFGVQALADPVRPPVMTKHQMIAKTLGCMRKRMSIDRVISYNEAAKACKDQLAKRSDGGRPDDARGDWVTLDSANRP